MMMNRKYLPYLLLLVAAGVYLFTKQHTHDTGGPGRPGQSAQPETGTRSSNNGPDDFDRSVSHIVYSKHAHCRMECRHIDENEVKEILHSGKVNTRKIETDSRGTTYPVEGIVEGHHLRIVFAPKGDDAVEVVTCIDLDHEWPCNCN